MNINTIINHLENLRDHFEVEEVKLTVPTLDGDDIAFIPVQSLNDICIIKVPVGDVVHDILYIDVDGLLEVKP